MRWNDKETVRFVELYRDHECLWDVTKLSYRTKSVRLEALENIVNEMGLKGFTVGDARQKVKSLRNTYSQELQKIENSMKSGSENLYTPTLKWFNIMDSFIGKTAEKKSTQNNLVSKFFFL